MLIQIAQAIFVESSVPDLHLFVYCAHFYKKWKVSSKATAVQRGTRSQKYKDAIYRFGHTVLLQTK